MRVDAEPQALRGPARAGQAEAPWRRTPGPRRLALIGNDAFAMLNFRGPLITAFAGLGVTVFALVPNLTPAEDEALRTCGATPVRYPLNPTGISPLADARATLSLYRLLTCLRPDMVLSFTVKPVVFGTLAAWWARIPQRYALIEGLGRAFGATPGRGQTMLRWTVSELYRVALKRATKTLFLTEDDRRELASLRIVDAAHSEVVGAVGVDLGLWQAAPPALAPITFIFVGRLLREKGVLEFIEAARRLQRRRTDLRFVVLGDLDRRPGSISETQMRAAVAEGVIEWPGRVPVRPWLERASILVLPTSYREGVPRVLQEALAMGRAVITTNSPGCRETVVEGENGLFVPAGDPATLAQAMQDLASDPDRIMRMGRRGRELAEARFDVQAANARMLRALAI